MTKGPVIQEQELMADIFAMADDPYSFVCYAYPWGKKGTPLENHTGPRKWQANILKNIRNHIQRNKSRIARGEIDVAEVLQDATSSGRGIGKSALLAMLSNWFMSTHLGATTVITANTETQLRTRTMAEMGKWTSMLINAHWFEKAAMSVKPAKWLAEMVEKQLKIDPEYWYISAQTWNADNADAFAGVHSSIGFLLLFDEASGIPDSIWKVAEGFFTDPTDYRFWLCWSNPRRNSGRFFECFHKLRDIWRTRYIDSREVEGTDHKFLQNIADKYGEDHDHTMVEVRGRFPSKGECQFMDMGDVQEARMREFDDRGAAVVMGVDVARYGSDQSVILVRQGRNARYEKIHKFRKISTMRLANRVAAMADRIDPDAIFIEGAGVGAGVVDRLKELRYNVIEVTPGGKADEEEDYANKRTEMWGRMREWMPDGCIWDDDELYDDLIGPEYKLDSKDRFMLESKDRMKERGIASPDVGDALALTFARRVARRDVKHSTRNKRTRVAQDVDYAIFG